MTSGLGQTSIALPARGMELRGIVLHALAAALMFMTPLVLFVPAAIISAGLRHGRRAAWCALAGAAAVVAAFSSLVQGPAQISWIARLIFEIGIPSVIAADLMRRLAPFGTVLVTATLASLAGFTFSEAGLRLTLGYSPFAAVVTNFRAQAEKTIAQYRVQKWPADVIETMSKLSDSVSMSYMPVVLVILTMLMFVLSIILIPRLSAGRATGGTYLFRNLRIPEWVLIAFALSGLAPLAQGELRTIGLSVLGIVMFLYVLQGLAIYRTLMLAIGLRMFGTLIALVLILLLTVNALAVIGLVASGAVSPSIEILVNGIPAFVLFLAGLFDSFFDFRKFNRKDTPDESDID